jgi:hypothetical protein
MTEEERREQEQLEAFLAHAARSPELRVKLRRVDPYQAVDIAAAEGFHFGVFTLHRNVCTGFVMPKTR